MILLDTCTLLWLASDPSRLSSSAREQIRGHADALFVSAISAFEIAVKQRKGALMLPLAPEPWFERVLEHHGIEEIPVTGQIASRAVALPPFHNDPCDRIIIATAVTQGLSIITPDEMIRSYGDARVLW